MSKITKPSGSRQLLGLLIGYFAGEQLVSYTGLTVPRGLPITLGIMISLAVSGVVVSHVFPRGSYGRKLYRYRMGQLGAWLASLLIGGFLPLLRTFVYSKDFLTYVLLVPPLVAGLYLLLIVQEGFDSPCPVKK